MGIWIRRILLGLLGLLIAIVLLAVGSVVFDSLFGDDTADFTNITYTNAEGEELLGYLAQPEGPGPHPAVLMIHEWWGLNEGLTVMADALAEEGYVVLAPDAYRGEVTDLIPRALFLRLTIPEDQVHSDLDTALAYLRSLDNVDAESVASMGFCFGGGHSLQLGLRESENLALTIIYYGDVITDAGLLRPLQEASPVLGVFAEEDQQIFVDDVLEFEAALNSLGIPNDITIYEGVGHAFINEENFNQPGVAQDAWQQAVDFLAENLQGQPVTE